MFHHRHSGLLLRLVAAWAAMGLSSACFAAWEGSFHSSVLRHDVHVRAVLPENSAPGELRFVTESCSLGLKATPAPNVFTILPMAADRSPGAYCGGWLGGRVEMQAGVDNSAMRMVVTSASGRSNVALSVREVP
jgi:hypothetical protein